MKKLLLSIAFVASALSFSFAQCSVQVNDSLMSNYDYVLNAIYQTGSGPFTYAWNVSDGNGMPIPHTVSAGGDSCTIDAVTLQNSYGCIIYQLCMTDMMGCMTCSGDTATLQVPFSCYSQFTSNMTGQDQVYVTLNSTMPPYIIVNQMAMWTDGNGQSQGMPYMQPGITIDYTPGPSNPSDKFFLCVVTNTVNGGCISCDSIQYRNSTVGMSESNWVKLSVAPNPVSSVATIQCSAPIEKLEVINSLGQVLKINAAITGGTAELNTADLPKGVYILRVNTALGTFEERMIKE